MGATFLCGTNSTKKPWDADKRSPFVLENTIDFASGTQFPTKPVQNDIIEALAVPADTKVLFTWIDVETAEPGAADCDVGVTGGNADGFQDGVDISAIGKKYALGTNAADTKAGGLVFPTADTIDIKLNSAVTHDVGKFKIKAMCIDLT
jgi:hypothetical protein